MHIKRATTNDFAQLILIWENSVRATHDFLLEKMIATLRPLILNNYLPNLQVYMSVDEQNSITGFMAIEQNRLEMLFIAPTLRRKGIGKALLQYAVTHFAVNEVDVNEQNKQAIDFYQQQGFKVYDRSELDGEGNPFPLLHLRLGDSNIGNLENRVSAAN
ncbi:acetyltransferase [Arsenophonus nasoniae]|uniref:Acetyltransferase n=2 Tax=Arsenophonus nasoniae TaxID=638 RepID=A0A4P7L0H8_9GAMM|nr:acetyltransferase [Arsenophonus nasoniae]QBY44500.1 putative N-acetyltransferase YjaB [Arsenophonus nasoniae]WGM00733.1 acetyltransferase [Arsenophonus nasoniae]WGM04760.1 acetyltransferase [Arsenophonus nasoniae]WGM09860.1 acetyltransferase [Arsenophonus nasoniae]WGM14579.1 acetyltransferase [Arsenophonus nasoniae]